jgi:four helix bundle protein
MARPKDFRELIVWQKAMSLAREVFEQCHKFPKAEAYDLMSQMRRAAVSVPSNIAEGHGRLTDAQFRHFLGNARGSLCEVQTQIELAVELGFLAPESRSRLIEIAAEVARLLNGLIAALGSSRDAGGGTSSANSASIASSAQRGR